MCAQHPPPAPGKRLLGRQQQQHLWKAFGAHLHTVQPSWFRVQSLRRCDGAGSAQAGTQPPQVAKQVPQREAHPEAGGRSPLPPWLPQQQARSVSRGLRVLPPRAPREQLSWEGALSALSQNGGSCLGLLSMRLARRTPSFPGPPPPRAGWPGLGGLPPEALLDQPRQAFSPPACPQRQRPVTSGAAPEWGEGLRLGEQRGRARQQQGGGHMGQRCHWLRGGTQVRG